MKSIAVALLFVAAASAASTVDFKREGLHGGLGYTYTIQDQPGVYNRAYKADQYSGGHVVPVGYPGIHAASPYYQAGSLAAADKPVTYVASQPSYQSVVPNVAYAAQPAYVQNAYVPGQPVYVH